MYINGEFVSSQSGRTRPIINPANQEVIAIVPEGDSADAQRAIQAARTAFDLPPNSTKTSWRWMPHQERSRVLREVARRVREESESLAALEVQNNGKPLHEARGDILGTADLFEQYAAWASTITGKHFSVAPQDLDCSVYYEPIGVCAGITPWNYPLYIAAWKIAPALATGNSIILKPSEVTPLTTLELARLIHEAGVPAGVVNIVTGTGLEVGTPLTESPLVDRVAFTGGKVTGRVIGEKSGRSLKKCSLELGGKSAQIIFADADLDRAVDGVMLGIFTNQGEVCSAGSRVLLDEKIHDLFVDKLMSKMRLNPMRLGSGLEPETHMGPLVTETQRQKVLAAIESGKKSGAKLLIGGGIPKEERLKNGFFVEPTVFDQVTCEMPIAQEEIFGPVLCLMTFKSSTDVKETEANAIALAHASDYGLAAGVWTENAARATRVIRQLNVGIVWHNTYDTTFNELPWSGRKQSGHGYELGWEGLHEYLVPKQVVRYIGP